jgi:Xaa-Pro aminopeptidase
MYGVLPKSWGLYKAFLRDLQMVLDIHDLDKDDPIGVDFLDGQLITVLQEEGFRISDGQDVMLNARMIKTRDEIQILADAAATADAAFDRVARAIRPGLRENDIQAEAAHELHRLGCQWVLNIQVTSGARTHPHPHLSSDRLIRPGDLIFLDIQTVYNGYQVCYYRTFCCGKPTQEQKDIYNRAYEWLMMGIDQIRPGNTTADVARVWPSAEELGFKTEAEAFGLAYAHGIGVGLWERPMVSRSFSFDHPWVLQEGMVMAVETYAGDGVNGARIESEVVVTSEGHEIITKFPADELIACGATY